MTGAIKKIEELLEITIEQINAGFKERAKTRVERDLVGTRIPRHLKGKVDKTVAKQVADADKLKLYPGGKK